MAEREKRLKELKKYLDEKFKELRKAKTDDGKAYVFTDIQWVAEAIAQESNDLVKGV